MIAKKPIQAALVALSILMFALVWAISAGASQKVGISTDEQTNSVATNLGLFGSTTWDIERDPTSNYIYVATKSPNGFFRSADGGKTWSGLPPEADYGQGQDIAVNPVNGHVYALLSTLIVSSDHGSTFKEITNSAGDNLHGSSLLYANGQLFLGLEDGTVKTSSDEGGNFSDSAVNPGTPIVSFATASDAIYALSKNRYSSDPPKLFRSTDNGASWGDLNISAGGVNSGEKIVANPNNSNLFLIPGSEGGTTWRSTNGGTSWTSLGASTPATGYMSFDHSGRTYVGWNYSLDNGDSWLPFGKGGSYGHDLVPDPTDDNTLYDTSIPGFTKSTDRGLSWSDSVEGITAVIATSISQANDKNIVWVATQNGLAKSTNFSSGSPSWAYPIKPSENFISSGKDSVWVDPNNPNVVVAGVSGSIWRSSDAGVSWTQATTDLDLNGTVARQISSDADGGAIFAAIGRSAGQGTAGGVLKSSNGGASWTSLDFPDNAATESVTLARDGDLFVGAGSANGNIKGLYKYSGGGWSKLPDSPDYEIRAVLTDPDAPDTIYALAAKTPSDQGTGFYKSTDDGKKFRHISSGLNNAYEFGTLAIQRSTTPNTLYLSAFNDLAGVIYKSSDGGENWGLFYRGLKLENFYALLFDGLVGANDRGLYSIKSRASLKLKAKSHTLQRGSNAELMVNLIDSTTKKKLKNRTVWIYKQVSGKWKRAKKAKTSRTGQAIVRLKLTHSYQLEARWKPQSKGDKQEYTSARSKRTRASWNSHK